MSIYIVRQSDRIAGMMGIILWLMFGYSSWWLFLGGNLGGSTHSQANGGL